MTLAKDSHCTINCMYQPQRKKGTLKSSTFRSKGILVIIYAKHSSNTNYILLKKKRKFNKFHSKLKFISDKNYIRIIHKYNIPFFEILFLQNSVANQIKLDHKSK